MSYATMKKPDTLEEAQELMKVYRMKKPKLITRVRMRCEDIAVCCPLSEEPDKLTLEIEYAPNKYLLETKSLRYWLLALRNYPAFSERVADLAAFAVGTAVEAHYVRADVTQHKHRGVSFEATASWHNDSLTAPEAKT